MPSLQGNLPDTEIEPMSLMSTCIDKRVLSSRSNYSARAELNLSSQMPILCLLGSWKTEEGLMDRKAGNNSYAVFRPNKSFQS